MRKTLGLVFLIALSALAGCGLHGKPSVDRSKALAGARGPVASATGATSAGAGRVVAPGVVESWGGDVSLSPQESGWIASITVAEGGRAEAGDVLAMLDDGSQRASVALAEAEVGEAEAALAKIMSGATAEELRQARAEAQAARVRAELATREAARAEKLGGEHAVSDVEAERAASDGSAAAALAQAAEAKLSAVELGARAEDRAVARKRLDGARARLDAARASLARRRVTAPTKGVVLLSRFHAGEFFTVGGAPLFVLGDTAKLQVRLEADEVDAFAIADGARCELFGDGGEKLGDGTIFRVAPRMGRRGLPLESPTARADVRVREVFVDAPTGRLVPGQRVWGHIGP